MGRLTLGFAVIAPFYTHPSRAAKHGRAGIVRLVVSCETDAEASGISRIHAEAG
jgi:hypothetical protein